MGVVSKIKLDVNCLMITIHSLIKSDNVTSSSHSSISSDSSKVKSVPEDVKSKTETDSQDQPAQKIGIIIIMIIL